MSFYHFHTITKESHAELNMKKLNLCFIYSVYKPSSWSQSQWSLHKSIECRLHAHIYTRLSIQYLRLTPYCLCVWRGGKDVKHSACRFPQDWPDSAENTAAALSVAINHIATRQTHFHHDVCRESPIPVNQVITHRPLGQPQLLYSRSSAQKPIDSFASIYSVIFLHQTLQSHVCKKE